MDKQIFGYKSLLARVILYTVLFLPCFPDKVYMVFPCSFLTVIIFNAWGMPQFKRIKLSEKYFECRSIYGLGKTEIINWTDITAVRMHFKSWGKIIWHELYIHKPKGGILKINMAGYFWFERKSLMKALEVYTTVIKDPPLPKFKDLL